MIALLFAFACAPDDCPEGRPDAVALDGVLESADTCGAWTLAVDDHVYVNVGLQEPEATCDATLPAHFTLPNDPIYSNFEPAGPKWTYDFLAVAPGDDRIAVVCEDGTEWSGWFAVE
jgi:hypothetical protein